MRDTSLDLDEHLAFAKEAPDHRLRSQLAEADRAHCELARVDSAAFNSYVLRDEATRKPIYMSPSQIEWHRLAARHNRVLIWSHVEAGKSTQISIGYTLFRLGQNPNLRIAIVSNTDGQGRKWTRLLSKYITESEELHRVFPKLQRGPKGMPWNEHTLTVDRPSSAKDASVTVYGVHGNVLGARIDLLILDDILDYENTKTQAQRDDLMAWYMSTLEGRLTADAQVICVGTAWHREDLMHRFAKMPNWFAVRYPVINSKGVPAWPQGWPMERIEAKKQAVPPLEFSRQFMCMARSDEDSRFKRDWIDACLARGEGKAMKSSIMGLPLGMKTFTGVDLGMGGAKSDLTVFFTILVYPNGDREILEVMSGRWTGPEIVERIVDVHYRFHSEIIVESNAAQMFVVQFTRNMSAVPVKPYTTTAKTHSPLGIEAMAVEFHNSKWVIPSKNGRAHPEIEAWINEVLYYDPQSHAGDRLMASFFAREGARFERPVIEFGRI